MRFLPLIWSNLLRKKVRSVLTILSVLVAFILYGYLCAVERALDQGVSMAGADRLLVRHRVSIGQVVPESYLRRIAAIPGVREVSHATWFGGIYKDPKNFFAQMAVLPEQYLRIYPEYVLPEAQKEAWFRNRTGAIVGRRTADRFGWKVGDRVPLQATIWLRKEGELHWEFDIVGIYDGVDRGTDTTNFLFHYKYLDEARRFGHGLVGWYMVRVADPAASAQIARRIDEEFRNAPTETKSETEGAFLAGWARQIGDITAIIAGILSAVFFTILLVAWNTMAQSVRERTEEWGVLKAMGFSNERVMLLVLGESCFLALAGGCLGLIVAWAMISRGDPTGGALPMFYFPRQAVLSGFSWAMGLGLASGILPASEAMRMRVADALRRT